MAYSFQNKNSNAAVTVGELNQVVNGLELPYKVYTALLTQSGTDDEKTITSGNLTIGVTYRIGNNPINQDFTNVGAPNNDADTYFVATGTTPNSWGNGNELYYNSGAPIVTVLENTIGNIVWEYTYTGQYMGRLNNAFTVNKTYFSITGDTAGDGWVLFADTSNLPDYFFLVQYDSSGSAINNMKCQIEIRVYN